MAKMFYNGDHSYITRINVKGRGADTKYNGAAFFSRKYCGLDFLTKLADGTIRFDVMDEVENSYDNVQGFYKEVTDKAIKNQAAFVIQWRFVF